VSNDTFLIRAATVSDAPGILTCLAAAFEEYRECYTPEAFEDTVLTSDSVAKRLKEMVIFVATDNFGRVLGTIACSIINSSDGHLRGMAVLPAFRGAGLAAQLLARAESHFAEKNCTRVTLDTTGPLQRAIRFYERFGFHLSGKTQDFFGMALFEYVKPLSALRPRV